MRTFIIGDVHGHLRALDGLLNQVKFSAGDRLFLTGDLINGHEHSVEVLRLLKSLGKQVISVLGNHDIMLLAMWFNRKWAEKILAEQKKYQLLNGVRDVFAAKDSDELVIWLLNQPSAYWDENIKILLIHAGVHKDWNLVHITELSKELSKVLKSASAAEFFRNMIENKSLRWSDELTGWDRLYCALNYLTRVRFCEQNGDLDVTFKGEIGSQPQKLLPWYQVPGRKTATLRLAFGHWSALKGTVRTPYLIALDTACRWGGCLTAYEVEADRYFTASCE